MADREETSDFVPTMLSFIQWYFRTLNPEFVEKVLGGRSLEEGASELLASIVADVRGNVAQTCSSTPAITAPSWTALQHSTSARVTVTRRWTWAVEPDRALYQSPYEPPPCTRRES